MIKIRSSSYLVRVGSVLMFSPVGGVAECLAATRELAHVGFLTCMRPQMRLQILKTRIGFGASLKLCRKKIFVKQLTF